LTDDEFKQKVHEFKNVLEYHMDEKLSLITYEDDKENEYWSERNFLTQKK
jgi:hypothetical protein